MTPREIYDQYHKLVYNIALQYLQNIEDAEEITQDVFINIFNNIQDFQHKSSLNTWIYRIAINKSIDFLRAKKRQKRMPFAFLSLEDKPDRASEQLNPHEKVENIESLQNLLECIYQLPKKEQSAILLLKMEQKSYQEVAEIMNTTVKAIEGIFYRAKQRLEKILNENKDLNK